MIVSYVVSCSWVRINCGLLMIKGAKPYTVITFELENAAVIPFLL